MVSRSRRCGSRTTCVVAVLPVVVVPVVMVSMLVSRVLVICFVVFPFVLRIIGASTCTISIVGIVVQGSSACVCMTGVHVPGDRPPPLFICRMPHRHAYHIRYDMFMEDAAQATVDAHVHQRQTVVMLFALHWCSRT